MKFNYYGHACFAVVAGGKTLLFDPFITPNPLAQKIDAGKIAAHFILVSHGHGDHVADLVEIAKRTGATVIAPFEVGDWFEKKGVKNVQAMNHGGAARTSFGRVKLTAAVHRPGLMPTNSKRVAGPIRSSTVAPLNCASSDAFIEVTLGHRGQPSSDPITGPDDFPANSRNAATISEMSL